MICTANHERRFSRSGKIKVCPCRKLRLTETDPIPHNHNYAKVVLYISAPPIKIYWSLGLTLGFVHFSWDLVDCRIAGCTFIAILTQQGKGLAG